MRTLGSARASRTGDRGSRSRTCDFVWDYETLSRRLIKAVGRELFRRAAETCTRVACAPRKFAVATLTHPVFHHADETLFDSTRFRLVARYNGARCNRL